MIAWPLYSGKLADHKFKLVMNIYSSYLAAMKNLALYIAVLCVFNLGLAQKPDRIIKENKVNRIISALASDDMRGRSALRPDQIEKATEFIEQEFRKSHLNFLDGYSSYRQEFQKHKLSLSRLSVMADGQAIPQTRTFLYSTQTIIQLDETTPILRPAENESLIQVYQQLRRDTTNHIVLVPNKMEDDFNRLQGYLSRPRIIDPETARPGVTLYVLGLDSVKSMRIEATQSLQPITLTNVVGMLEGHSRKDEYVVFSSHYDHLGISAPVNGDSISNGADDDASGTTAVIELARYFSKIKSNERTLIFVAFTAEEIGGFGSRYFSEQLNPDKVVAMFNIEMIGKPSKWGVNSAFITGFERSDFGQILQRNLKETPFTFYPDPYPEENLFYRSDNATLARQGVPAHSISTDQINIDPYYHKVTDEVSTLNIHNLAQTIKAIAMSAATIVTGTDTPSRVDQTTLR